MITRRKEGEQFRNGINWQYDKFTWGYWLGLYFVLPYWIEKFTWTYKWDTGKMINASSIKKVRLGIAISTGKKFHWMNSAWTQLWRIL